MAEVGKVTVNKSGWTNVRTELSLTEGTRYTLQNQGIDFVLVREVSSASDDNHDGSILRPYDEVVYTPAPDGTGLFMRSSHNPCVVYVNTAGN